MVLASEKDLVDSIDVTKVAKNGHCSKIAAKYLITFMRRTLLVFRYLLQLIQ